MSKYKVKYLFILWWKMYVWFDISFHTAQQVRGNGVSQNCGTSVCCCYLQQHKQNTGNNFNSMLWTRVIWTFNCTNLTSKTATYGIIKLTNFTRSCHLISLSKHSSHFTDIIEFIALPYQKPLACFRTCITLYMCHPIRTCITLYMCHPIYVSPYICTTLYMYHPIYVPHYICI